MGEKPPQPQGRPGSPSGQTPQAPGPRPSERKVPAGSAAQGRPPAVERAPGPPAGQVQGPPPPRTASGRLAAQGSQTRSTRRISARAGQPGGSQRMSRRLQAKKKRDVAPILVAGVLILAAVGGVMGYFYRKQGLTRALAAGGQTAFEALYAVAESGPSAVPTLCEIIERGGPGRMAAAGALAQVARLHGAEKVVPAIRERLKPSLSADSRAAYAAALGQGGSAASEEAAAALAADPNETVRLAAIQGLARGRSPAAAQALGKALADPGDTVRAAAEAALIDLARTAPERALEAVVAALSLKDERAHEPAARVALAAARKAQPAQLLPLLSSGSPEVRAKGVGALVECMIASGARDQASIDRIAALLSSREEPAKVKAAALDAVLALGIAQAGPAALDCLRTADDAELQAKAALAVGATKPEGALDALLSAILRDDSPKELRASALEALARTGRAKDERLMAVARTLVDLAEGKDELLAGLALLALRSVAGRPDAKYAPAQWKMWLARRAFELDALARTRGAFEAIKKAHGARPDVEKTRKAVNELGTRIQAVRDKADAPDQGPFDDLIREMVAFNRSIVLQRK